MQKWLDRFGQLYPLIISFFISFLVIQATFLYQYRTTNFTELLLFSVIQILSQLSLFCIFGSSLLFIIQESWIKWFKRFYFFLLFAALIGSVVCDQYLLFSRERLDESFFLFDWEEIWMIADPSNRFTWSLAIGMILIFTLPFALFKFFKDLPSSNVLFPILVFGSIFLGFIPRSYQVDNVSENRFVYFIQRSLNSYFFTHEPTNATLKDFKNLSSDFYGGHVPLDPRFPLAHRMDESAILNQYLAKTSDGKPPNIKVIIVESMSSDLFGQRGENTGVLMSFMDSLSKKSLYFPNGFSTSQRTHNVLPALLASVPNTIDGNVFQQLPFPRHYSLFNLLRKNYHTQFYCGVRLEYLNMVGLMSHYKTDYLSKNWNRDNQIHKESVGSAWGFPDEDLFKQAQFDDSCKFNKLRKPIFKVFLTISSHDPFIYPNKSKWEKVVLQKASTIKDKRLRYMIRSQASSFGAFSYVDSTLKRFFEVEKERAGFKNTVYIITGDHGTELYRRNSLSKYNVPILIYSPLLKKSETSQALVSHNDIAPTILNYLKTAYKIEIPDTISFVGKELKMGREFKPDRSFVFTTNKLRTSDLINENLVYINGRLTSLDAHLEIKPIITENRDKTKWIKRQLKEYQALSNYTILQNKLIDSLSYVKWTGDKSKYVLRKTVNLPQLDSKNQMTYLTSCNLLKNKSLKIELLTSIWCHDKKAINKAPTLVIQSRKSKYLSFKWTVNKQIKCHYSDLFKGNSMNQVVYHLEFNPKEIEKFKNLNSFHLYLLNESKQKIKLNNVRLNYYVSE
jgi:phosphoglycerol transferase MdoB-like AlkP superfamily enzyme